MSRSEKMEKVSKKVFINISMFVGTALIISGIICLTHREMSLNSFRYVFNVALIGSGLMISSSVISSYVVFRIIKCKIKFWSFYNSMLPFLLLVLIAGVVEFLYIKEKVALQIVVKLSGYIVEIYTAYIVHKKYDVERKKCFIYLAISFIIGLFSFL